MVAWDMHVGFKVQLVVEFYIYPLCLDRSQIQNNRRNTWAGASKDEPSAAPAGSIVSLLGEAVPVSSAAADPPLLGLFPQVWEVHLAPGMQFLYACVSQMGSINCLGPFDNNGRLVVESFCLVHIISQVHNNFELQLWMWGTKILGLRLWINEGSVNTARFS